jgi:hypothetical protein
MSDLYEDQYTYNNYGGVNISKFHIVTVATESKYYFPYLQELERNPGSLSNPPENFILGRL